MRHTTSNYVKCRENRHDSYESLCDGRDRDDDASHAPEPFETLWIERGSAPADLAEGIFRLEALSSERVRLELERLLAAEREALVDLLCHDGPASAAARQAQKRGLVRLTLGLADEVGESARGQRRLLEALGSAAATHMKAATRRAWTHVNHASRNNSSPS